MEQVPDFQRVLVLQGGGSLGAYEAGAFQALSEKLTEEDTKRGFKGRPLADIVAGTSIGAINSTIDLLYRSCYLDLLYVRFSFIIQ